MPEVNELINSQLEKFDEIFPNNVITERNLTIEEMEKRNTYYTKELVSYKSFLKESLTLAYQQGKKDGAKEVIRDIPDNVGYIVRSPDPHIPPMNIPIKQQLTEKYVRE